jgi:hypothetical protein
MLRSIMKSGKSKTKREDVSGVTPEIVSEVVSGVRGPQLL